MEGLVMLLLYVVVLGLVCYILWWLIGYIGLPEPFNKVARVIVAIIGVLILLNLVFGLGGVPIIRWR